MESLNWTGPLACLSPFSIRWWIRPDCCSGLRFFNPVVLVLNYPPLPLYASHGAVGPKRKVLGTVSNVALSLHLRAHIPTICIYLMGILYHILNWFWWKNRQKDKFNQYTAPVCSSKYTTWRAPIKNVVSFSNYEAYTILNIKLLKIL